MCCSEPGRIKDIHFIYIAGNSSTLARILLSGKSEKQGNRDFYVYELSFLSLSSLSPLCLSALGLLFYCEWLNQVLDTDERFAINTQCIMRTLWVMKHVHSAACWNNPWYIYRAHKSLLYDTRMVYPIIFTFIFVVRCKNV